MTVLSQAWINAFCLPFFALTTPSKFIFNTIYAKYYLRSIKFERIAIRVDLSSSSVNVTFFDKRDLRLCITNFSDLFPRLAERVVEAAILGSIFWDKSCQVQFGADAHYVYYFKCGCTRIQDVLHRRENDVFLEEISREPFKIFNKELWLIIYKIKNKFYLCRMKFSFLPRSSFWTWAGERSCGVVHPAFPIQNLQEICTQKIEHGLQKTSLKTEPYVKKWSRFH